MNNIILKINNLNKSFYSLNGEIEVLNNISFDVIKGEYLSIIGSSGCGKSSILNILSGLDNEYDGKIKYNGDIRIGYMLQNDSLFDWLTVYENAVLGLKIQKEYNEVNINHVKNLISKYGLKDFINSYPSSLSGGMRQRVG